MKLLTIIAALLTCAAPAMAGNLMPTGEALLKFCKSPEASNEYLGCLIYLRGFGEGANWSDWSRGLSDKSATFCTPKDLTMGETAYAFLPIAHGLQGEERQKLLAGSMQEFAGTVMSRAYPCKK